MDCFVTALVVSVEILISAIGTLTFSSRSAPLWQEVLSVYLHASVDVSGLVYVMGS